MSTWPLRPERLTDLIPAGELKLLLRAGAGGPVGERLSGLAACEVDVGDPASGARERDDRSVPPEFRALCADELEGDPPDPFCTYFRRGTIHAAAGDAIAFRGADAACARCEALAVRKTLVALGDARREDSRPVDRVERRRCHMGLTDSIAPIIVEGRALGALVAGRRVESDDDRVRIRKSVGKLGKLTRAEQANPARSATIEPRDDNARERLVREIGEIPACSIELDDKLAAFAARLAEIAERRWADFQRREIEALLDSLESAQRELDLERVRARLGLSFIALFASPAHRPSGGDEVPIAAAVGLGRVEPGMLSFAWSRLPEAPSEGLEVTESVRLGRGAISATISGVRANERAADAKTLLTKSAFFLPLVARGRRAVVAFGSPDPGRELSSTDLDESDFVPLVRLASALVQSYRLGELDRFAAESESRLGAVTSELATLRETVRQNEEIPGQRFDLRKLLDECLVRARAAAEAKALGFDTRGLADRAIVVAERKHVRDIVDRLVAYAIDRSEGDGDGEPLAPVRLVLRRRRGGVLVGIEAVGKSFGVGDRRRLFRSAKTPAAERSESSREIAEPPEGDAGLLRWARDVLRRYRGRLNVSGERLRRTKNDESKWLGSIAIELELPLAPPAREKARVAPPPASGSASARKEAGGKARPSRRRRRGGAPPR